MPTNVAVHTISFRGKAGAIFVLLCSSIVLYLIAFVTHGWSFKTVSGSTQKREGLWETCQCERNNKSSTTESTGIGYYQLNNVNNSRYLDYLPTKNLYYLLTQY